MMRAVGPLLLLAACSPSAAPAPAGDRAMTAAEAKAVADTDGARRDATSAPTHVEQSGQ